MVETNYDQLQTIRILILGSIKKDPDSVDT